MRITRMAYIRYCKGDCSMSRTQSIGGCPVAHEASAPADHHGFEPFNQDDPFPSYSRLRHEQPVMFDDRTNLYVVSAYDDVKAVFEDWETFSSENAQAPVRSRGPQATQIMNDGGFTVYSGLSARRPPEHTRIRAVAQKAFTPRRFKVLEPMIRDRKSTRLNSSHVAISYAVFCLK